MPASPGGSEIGRLYVKVLPDTTAFENKAKSELRRIEKRLKVNVGATFDATGLRREMLLAIRELNAKNKATASHKVRLYTRLEAGTDSVAQIKSIVRELSARATAYRVGIQTDLIAGDIVATLDKDSLDEIARDLEDFRRKHSPIKIVIRPELAIGSTSFIAQRLNVLTRPRRVPIFPVLNTGAVAKVATALAALSGARLALSTIRRIGDSLKNLDKNIPLVGALALAIAGLAGWALSAASNLFSLSYSLAQIIPAALVLPGIFGGIVIGLGVSIAAFKDFNAVLPEVGAAFSALQDSLSANFWEQAKAPISEFINDLMPRLTEGVNAAGTALGTYFGGLATAFTSILNPALAGMFTDLAASILVAETGTRALAGIITSLGTIGVGYLPRLATFFVDITTQFDAFLARTSADGSLQGWVDQGIFNLTELGRVLGNLGGIFAGLGQAAQLAGGSTLTTFADTLQNIEDTVKSSGFQAALVGALTGAHKMMENISNGSGPAVAAMFENIATTFGNIAPSIGMTIGTIVGAFATLAGSEGFLSGVTQAFTGIGVAVSILAPVIAGLGPTFGALGSVIATLAANYAPIIATLLTVLGDVFVQIAPLINQVITMLGGAFAGVLQTVVPLVGEVLVAAFQALMPILPVIAQLMTLVGEVLGTALAAVLPVVAPLITTLAIAFAGILTALMPLIGPLLQLVLAVLTPLLSILAPVVSMLGETLVTALNKLVPAVMPFIAALTAIVGFLMPILVPAIKFVADILISSLGAALDGVANIFTGVVSIITGLWDIVAGIFTGDWSRVWEGVKSVFSGVWDTVVGIIQVALNIGILGLVKKAFLGLRVLFVTGWDNIVAFFKGLPAKFGSAMDTVRLSLMYKADALWTGLKGLFRTGIDNLVTFFKELPAKLLTFLVAVVDNMLIWADNLWVLVKTAFVNGINAVISFVSTLGTRILVFLVTTADNMLTWADNAWVAVKTAFTTGIQTVVSFVAALPARIGAFFVSLATNMLARATVAWLYVKTAYKAGIDIVVNFVKALPAKIATFFIELSKSMQTKATAAWTAVKTAFTSGINAVVSFVKGLPNKAGNAFLALAAVLQTKAVNAWTAVKTAFSAGISAAVSLAGSLGSRAADAVGNLGSKLASAGRSLIQGFIDGIKRMIGSVKSTLTNLTGNLTDWKGPESLDRVLLTHAGELVIQGFINGLESKYDAVRKSLGGLTKDVAGTSFALDTANVARGSGVSGALSKSVESAVGNPALAGASGAAGGGVTIAGNVYTQDVNELVYKLDTKARDAQTLHSLRSVI